MTKQQDHIPETPTLQNEALIESLSFVERHNIHPLLFACAVLAIIFVLYQAGGRLVVFFAVGAGEITRNNVQLVRLLTMLGQLLFLLLPTLLFARLLSRKKHEIFPVRVPGIQESIVVLVALFSLQRVFEAYLFFQDKVPIPKLLQELLDPIKKMMESLVAVLVHTESMPELFFVILVVAIVPAIAEELLFRGLIQSTFNRMMPPSAAAILSGIIFGLYHVNPFEAVPLVGLGIFFGILRYRSQSLAVPIAAHFLNNVLAVLAGYFGMESENMLEAARFTPAVSTVLLELVMFGMLFAWSFITYIRLTRAVCSNQGIS